MNLVEEYLECYLSLTDPTRSKQANKRLLEIQASPEAWTVASKLIQDSDGSKQIHGCQLLSQKLSRPLPGEVSADKIAEFLYARPAKSKLHWLCLAKSLLHLSPKQPLTLDSLASDADRLSILRQMPSAIIQTHNLDITDNKLLLQQYLDINKGIILANFEKMEGVVIDLLEYFLESGAKLGSEELLLRVLRLPIEDTGVLLEQVMNRQTFPNLIGEISAYLKAVENHQDAFAVHLSFYRGHLTHFSDSQFTYMVSYILGSLEHRDDADFCQSYYLWQDLMNQHQENRLSIQKSACLENALVVLWRLVCTRCILAQLPNATGVPESSLSLDLDGQGQQAPQELECNNRAERFRQQAGDFLSVCLRTLGNTVSFSQQVGASLQALASSTLLELELAIYVLGSICDSLPAASYVGRSAVVTILRREEDLNEYLCGKVVELISKLAELFAEAPQCLAPCLSFLAKCMRYSSLAPLASESCCQLLEEANEGALRSQELQEFLTHLFELFFNEPLSDRTRSNLAKTMVVFIHKFKRTPANYAEYLTNYAQRLDMMDEPKRTQFLEAAIMAQFWLNVHDEERMRGPFQDFLDKQCVFLLGKTLASKSKEELTEAINLISLAIKTNAVSRIDTWIHVVSQITQSFLSPEKPMAIVLSPLVQLGKAALQIGGQTRARTAELLGKWASPVSQLLRDDKKLEFSISNAVVQVHLTLLQLLDGSVQAAQRANYTPERLLGYICRCFDESEIWEYELYKNSLSYLTLALRLGAPVRPILGTIFRNYRKFAETLWTSVEPLLFAGFRAGGASAVLGALTEVKPEFDAKNPLTYIIEESLARGQGKSIKNILLALC